MNDLPQPELAVELSGFLPTRAGFMLDLICVALVAIVPAMAASICLVRLNRQYQWHKRIQLGLAAALLVAVLAFEIDVRFITDWQKLAAPSPYFEPGTWNAVWYSLIVHLCFAIPTLFLWIYVVVQAIRFFPVPAAPSAHSALHRRWAWAAAIGMLMTSVTGWIFYWLAFVA